MKAVSIDRLKEMAQEFGLPACVIVFTDGETIGYTSYGFNREVCAATKKVADNVLKVLQDPNHEAMWALRDVLYKPRRILHYRKGGSE